MDWYSLIFIHKYACRAMLSECLTILNYLSREVELRTFETISQQRFDFNFNQVQFTSFLKVFQIIENRVI